MNFQLPKFGQFFNELNNKPACVHSIERERADQQQIEGAGEKCRKSKGDNSIDHNSTLRLPSSRICEREERAPNHPPPQMQIHHLTGATTPQSTVPVVLYFHCYRLSASHHSANATHPRNEESGDLIRAFRGSRIGFWILVA